VGRLKDADLVSGVEGIGTQIWADVRTQSGTQCKLYMGERKDAECAVCGQV
jgi:hypothetical protein